MIGMGYDIINRRRGEKAKRGKRDVVKRYVKRHSEILRGKSKFSLGKLRKPTLYLYP